MSPTRSANALGLRGPCAVIDIGSSALRIVLADIRGPAQWTELDHASQPVSLGRDVFVTGTISRETMIQCLHVLEGFRELMATYRIAPDRVKVIATSALREAKNRDIFIDRVAVRTGFQINIVEGIEANHLTYLAVRHALRDARPRFSQTNSIIMEVGGGSTEIMLLQRGRMVAAHQLHIGTVRMDQQIRTTFGPGYDLVSFLDENLRTTCKVLDGELPLARIHHFIAVGGDARVAASLITGREFGQYLVVEREAFEQFLTRLEELPIDDIVEEYHMPYDEAEQLLPALMVYRRFLSATTATHLIVPNVSIRDGVLITLSAGVEEHIHQDYYTQVTASALSLGRKYHLDENHARHVAKLAISLFNQLKADHGLTKHHRLLLEVAALLHDVGSYVNPSGHHKHGQYIVANSDLFGLRPDEIEIIANVVRYHRKSVPGVGPSHESYMALTRDDRIVVSKLAALLRIADGLDRGHNQRIAGFTLERHDDELLIHAQHDGEIEIERFSVIAKGDLFQDIFGLKPILL
jgi:exopolyphosphatase/guanosine-5'-triphosphate,3'-diphosphate pyrophosphatase